MSTNHQMAKDRAESFFDIYLLMGAERSLAKLQQTLTDSGLSITLTTLKSYSTNYDWQLRITKAQEMAQAQKEISTTSRVISEMNDRQARLGHVMQGVAERNIANTIQYAVLSTRDTVYLADVGVKMERLAKGEATTRQAVAHEMLSPVVYNIVQLFQQVNSFDDVERRQREFAIGCDAILEQIVGKLGGNDD